MDGRRDALDAVAGATSEGRFGQKWANGALLVPLATAPYGATVFGFLADSGGWQRWFFVTVGIVISILILTTLLRKSSGSEFFKLGLMLILGGAVGNIIDRVSQGYVIDFVDLYWQSWHWPAFNVADVAISIGAFFVLMDVFRSMGTGARSN